MDKMVMKHCIEPMWTEYYFRIFMKARTGKKLYLREDHWYGKNYEKINCKWSPDWNEALFFKTEKDAQEFAKEYFKNFKNYEIEEFEFHM